MLVTNKIKIDIARQGFPPSLDAVQNDANARSVEITLLENGSAWTVPSGVSASVSYVKPDGTSGLYDRLPNGVSAVEISGSTIRFTMAPQMLTVPGLVRAVVVLIKDTEQLSTFPLDVHVIAQPGAGAEKSENYYHYKTFEALNNAIGLIKELETEDKSSLVAAINEIARKGGNNPEQNGSLYIGSDEPTGDNRPLYWLDTSMDDVPVQPEEPDVPVEPDEPGTVTYTIINKLTNVTNSNTAASIEANASYKATLTAAGGYELGTVTVTMGGTDVTSTVYADGVVNISAVTGNVVITATAKEASGETDGGIFKLADISVETTADNDASGNSKAGYTRYKIEGVKTGDIVRLAGTSGSNEHGWYDGTNNYSLSDTTKFTKKSQDNYSWYQYTWVADADYDYLYFGSMTSRLETNPNSAATLERGVS